MLLGICKFYLERLGAYAAKVQFILVLYLFFKESGASLWWIAAALPLGGLVIWFDRKYILPGELAEFLRRNPEWVGRNDDKSQRQA